MIDCDAIIKTTMEYIPKFFSCDTDGKYAHVRTPFMYPDGDLIDVWVAQHPNGDLYATDMGECFRYLDTYLFNVFASRKRESLLEDIVNSLGVINSNGKLIANCQTLKDVPPAIFAVAQAIIRICDLLFTTRQRTPGNFRDDVKDFLFEERILYKEDYVVTGKSSQEYEVDLAIPIPHKLILTEALSASTPSRANTLTSEAVRMWVDIGVTTEFSFMAILDDSNDLWQEAWINLMAEWADVVYWSQRDVLVDELRAKQKTFSQE